MEECLTPGQRGRGIEVTRGCLVESSHGILIPILASQGLAPLLGEESEACGLKGLTHNKPASSSLLHSQSVLRFILQIARGIFLKHKTDVFSSCLKLCNGLPWFLGLNPSFSLGPQDPVHLAQPPPYHSFPLLVTSEPLRPWLFFSNVPSSFLPQGLCACCSFLEHSTHSPLALHMMASSFSSLSSQLKSHLP